MTDKGVTRRKIGRKKRRHVRLIVVVDVWEKSYTVLCRSWVFSVVSMFEVQTSGVRSSTVLWIRLDTSHVSHREARVHLNLGNRYSRWGVLWKVPVCRDTVWSRFPPTVGTLFLHDTSVSFVTVEIHFWTYFQVLYHQNVEYFSIHFYVFISTYLSHFSILVLQLLSMTI